MKHIHTFESFLNESSTGKVEITKDVKTAYDLWNDSSFPPGKLYRFNTGLKDPRDILNSFAHELEVAKLVKIYSYGHPYEEAIKWLEKNIK
jgi:hypothetical protein